MISAKINNIKRSDSKIFRSTIIPHRCSADAMQVAMPIRALIGIATCIASAEHLWGMIVERKILLSDLFMLFIFAEIIGMVGAFYSTNRIPVTLPMIIAITAVMAIIIGRVTGIRFVL